ncbi:MAG: hypothetical protein GC159_08370 [Phycisphaera sp.]|nr:hypothetical protein [Phycisphaera sp.]
MPYRCIAALLALSFVIVGCDSVPKGTRYDDPVAKMMDKSETYEVRWAAAHQAEAERFADPARVSALQKMVWMRGHPAEFSNYAVDQLVKVNEADAKTFFSKSIVLIRDWETLQHVIDTAVARKWTDFVPALVRNYAQTTPVYKDADRPERKAIQALRPDAPVEQVILEVLAAETDEGADEKTRAQQTKERAAAWQLTYRLLGDRQKLVDLLGRIEPRNTLITDLKAAATDLNVVPTNMQEITWMQMLRTGVYGAFWERAKLVVSQLTPEQKRDLQLRHLPIIIYLHARQPDQLHKNKAQLLSELTAFVDSQPHYLHGPTYDGPMQDHPQVLHTWAAQLAWGDLAATHVAIALMRDRHAAASLFEQADADLIDKTTEYGGLIRLDDKGTPYPQIYKPMMRRHDLIFYPTDQMMLDAYAALMHYHFHAQEQENRQYAGPGLGDMKNIRRQRLNGLVFTFIDHDTLNVDYYQPEEVVIDMGVIRR